MSSVNELRKQAAQLSLAAGPVALTGGIVLWLFGSSWGAVLVGVGLLLTAAGIKTFVAVAVVEGIPRLIGMISRHTEPEWDGELLYTDGGRHKVRYTFDSRSLPYFVASDVCVAIGAPAPRGNALQWGEVPLVMRGEHLCFSRDSVQAYLIPLAVHDHEANRLLTLLRNEVFRKLDREQESARLAQGR